MSDHSGHEQQERGCVPRLALKLLMCQACILVLGVGLFGEHFFYSAATTCGRKTRCGKVATEEGELI